MEGRRKEVLLLVLALAALGIALYTFRSKPAPLAPTSAAEKPTGTAPGEEAAAPSPTGKAGEQQAAAAAAGTAAGAGEQRNPFVAPGGEASAATSKAGAAVPAGGPSATGTPSAGGEPGPSPSTPPKVQPAPGTEQKLSLTLTGIVNGKPNMAILRQDDRRYFVKVGDTVGDGYRVKSIGNQQVVLVGQQGKVTLRMGGRQ